MAPKKRKRRTKAQMEAARASEKRMAKYYMDASMRNGLILDRAIAKTYKMKRIQT